MLRNVIETSREILISANGLHKPEATGVTSSLNENIMAHSSVEDSVMEIGAKEPYLVDVNREARACTSLVLVHKASKKSQQKFRDKIRAELNHWSTWRSSEEMIKRVNRITRGWGNYYHYGNSCETFTQLNQWLRNRLRNWLVSKHKSVKVSKYKNYSDALLLEEMCLAQLDQKPHWV
jgi:hypothetical protein